MSRMSRESDGWQRPTRFSQLRSRSRGCTNDPRPDLRRLAASRLRSTDAVRDGGRSTATTGLHRLPDEGRAMLSQLQAVLDRAHRGHTYVTDAHLHGVPEHWDIALVGD